MFNQFVSRILHLSPLCLALTLAVLLQALLGGSLSWLYRQAADEQLQLLRKDIARILVVAAEQVDVPLHRRLERDQQTGGPLYRQAIEPLLKIHKSLPEINYLYTMVRRGGERYFVLDTAFYADELSNEQILKASRVMERYTGGSDEDQALFASLEQGKVYVFERPYVDYFGEHLSGFAPLQDEQGRLVAMLGLDFGMEQLDKHLRDIRTAYISTLLLSILVSALLAWLLYRVRSAAARAEKRRMQLEQQTKEQAKRTELILDSIIDGVLGLDAQGLIISASRVVGRIWQRPVTELRGKNLTSLIDGPDQPLLLSSLERARQGQHCRIEVQGRRLEDQLFPLEMTLSPGHQGESAWFVVAVRDLSRDMAIEDERHLAALVFSNMADGVMVTDPDGRILMVNKAFSEITGYQPEQVRGRSARLLQSGRHDASFYRSFWQSLLQQGHWQGEIYNRRYNGSVYPEWLTINAVYDRAGRLQYFVGVFTDITQRKEQEARLHQLANQDQLTGLANRAAFQEHFNTLLLQARCQEFGFALLFMDLDDFKRINDTLGHAEGDKLLRGVAQRLLKLIPEEAHLARIGGDEFVILLPLHQGGQEQEVSARLAARILEDFRHPYVLSEQEVVIGTSIGISRFPQDGQSMEMLLKQADMALYDAKSRGRNAYHFYTTAMHAQAMERMALETQLHQAMQREELRLVYQPQVCIRTGQLLGMEALLRWQHPQWGEVSPLRFIPVAEESGMIIPLGNWVLERAARQLAQWREQGIELPRLSVNLSPRQFLNSKHLLQQVSQLLQRYQIQPQQLELEITESILMDSSHASQQAIRQLESMGVLLAIDDFGTGYSSLGYLQKFRLHQLKIDRSFIQDLASSQHQQAIVQAMIQMGHALEMEVIAEGVETAEQLILLQQHDCDGVQGYLYSKPLEVTAVADFIHTFQLQV
ncbi:putative bifunctional diguanylate cyclase/phosphodiesterase [Balneatrix alpica]|uniref:putative bifunctional diguanylate cyclase/phosphodiesterase n=1 Tax=Balneatrix alpica TaxID=75684 RepID=UPI0027383FC5|nr:EAL domain-containing protein [Balneatrix alpica]